MGLGGFESVTPCVSPEAILFAKEIGGRIQTYQQELVNNIRDQIEDTILKNIQEVLQKNGHPPLDLKEESERRFKRIHREEQGENTHLYYDDNSKEGLYLFSYRTVFFQGRNISPVFSKKKQSGIDEEGGEVSLRYEVQIFSK